MLCTPPRLRAAERCAEKVCGGEAAVAGKLLRLFYRVVPRVGEGNVEKVREEVENLGEVVPRRLHAREIGEVGYRELGTSEGISAG